MQPLAKCEVLSEMSCPEMTIVSSLRQDKAINAIFGEVRLMQGKIIGQMNALDFSAKEEVTLAALTLDVVKSSEIEG